MKYTLLIWLTFVCTIARAQETGAGQGDNKAKRPPPNFVGSIGWHADAKNWIGIMFVGLHQRKTDMYLSFRTRPDFFKKGANWETDNNNSLAESPDRNKKFTGERLQTEIHANIGLTRKLVKPLWIYAGAGFSYSAEMRKFTSTSGNQEEYVENKDTKYGAFNPEIGLYAWLGPFVLRYGINRPLHSRYTGSVMHSFGVGINVQHGR